MTNTETVPVIGVVTIDYGDPSAFGLGWAVSCTVHGEIGEDEDDADRHIVANPNCWADHCGGKGCENRSCVCRRRATAKVQARALAAAQAVLPNVDAEALAAALEAAGDVYQAEEDAALAAMIGETRFADMQATPEGVRIHLIYAERLKAAMVGAWREHLGDAENYVESEVFWNGDRGPERYVVTVRRLNGKAKTPHQLRVEAEQALERLTEKYERNAAIVAEEAIGMYRDYLRREGVTVEDDAAERAVLEVIQATQAIPDIDAAQVKPIAAGCTVTVTYDGDTHWLECERCTTSICTVEAGDSLESLVLTAAGHVCEGGTA